MFLNAVGERAIGGLDADVLGLQDLAPRCRGAVKNGLSASYAVSDGNNTVQIWRSKRFDLLGQVVAREVDEKDAERAQPVLGFDERLGIG